MGKKKSKESDEIEIPLRWVFVALGFLALIALFLVFIKSGLLGAGKVSQAEAEQTITDFFAAEIPTSQIQILESSRKGDFYEFVVSLDGEQVPLYVTLDGKYMTIDLIPLE